MKIVFMGSSEFAIPSLKALLANRKEISAVYTQPARPAGRGKKLKHVPLAEYALIKGITIHQPLNFNQPCTVKTLKNYEPDVIVVISYGLLLPKEILSIPKLFCINVHASLLPRWRGASPINHSIFSRDDFTGISIIKMVEELDAGPILNEKKIALTNKKNYGDLYSELGQLGAEVLLDTLERPNLSDMRDQDVSKVTYAPKIKKEDTKIDFNNSAFEIEAKIRGLAPSPGAWFEYRNERLKIFKANVREGSGRPGEIVDTNFVIGCGQSLIQVLEIQRSGKSVLKVEDFLKGWKITKGDFVN
ncbi:methionyl-tRNA formyltransferase [bacterium TMED277]|nr:MAG: methionyl-tRNA formyltransferase [bacterium TMED277]